MYLSSSIGASSTAVISVAGTEGGGSPQLYYHDCSGRIPGHTTRAPPVGFELETNCFQFYAIANLDKTSRHSLSCTCLVIEDITPPNWPDLLVTEV